MMATGKAYGLEVTSLTDDRRDPVKSSYAAARYLRDLYLIFGDWNLVIAAYNCGPENINRAIRRSGGKRDYWEIYPYLPKETRGYVPAFIAANYAMTYYCEHGICPMASRLPIKTDTVMVSQNIDFAKVAAVCNIDIDMIRSLNPVYRKDIIPGYSKPSPLRLPLSDISRFIDMEDSIYAMNSRPEVKAADMAVVEETVQPTPAKRDRNRAVYHTIKRGDTLSAIARRNGTTVAKIKRLNGLRSDNVRIGTRLRVK
jgi:membrane-bound lytic murein transglycosylase D